MSAQFKSQMKKSLKRTADAINQEYKRKRFNYGSHNKVRLNNALVGIKRMGHEIKATMQQALQSAIKAGEIESFNEASDHDLMTHTMRAAGSDLLVIRTRGDRSFEEITPSEVQFIAKYLIQQSAFAPGSDLHLRLVLEFFDLRRLTTQVGSAILDILKKDIPHVDLLLERVGIPPNQ